MIFLAINGVLVAEGRGGGGGGQVLNLRNTSGGREGAGNKFMEYIRVSTPRMMGPFHFYRVST